MAFFKGTFVHFFEFVPVVRSLFSFQKRITSRFKARRSNKDRRLLIIVVGEFARRRRRGERGVIIASHRRVLARYSFWRRVFLDDFFASSKAQRRVAKKRQSRHLCRRSSPSIIGREEGRGRSRDTTTVDLPGICFERSTPKGGVSSEEEASLIRSNSTARSHPSHLWNTAKSTI